MFLPASNALLEEALTEASETLYEQTLARVISAEHLAAICVQTGREKDRQRVRLFLEEAGLDMARLDTVLTRHNLKEKWNQWTT